jgi:hypothetical protein
MADFSFERERLVAGIDELLEKMQQLEVSDDARVDNFVLVVMLADEDEEEGEIEYPITWCESSRPHVKLGILHMTVNLMDRGDIS